MDVLQWKRSKDVKHYCHFVHGSGGTLLYRLFSLDYFDSIIAVGEVEINEIRLLEKARNIPEKQLIVAGNTFYDRCSQKIKEIPKEDNHQFTVLLSPSWGPNALLNMYGVNLIDPLVKTGWKIIIRPHPQSIISEKEMVASLTEKYKDVPNIEWDFNNENIYTLSRSDIMISDFSSIIYDFVFLFDRPVVINLTDLDYRRLDAQDIEQEIYFIRALKKIGYQINTNNIHNIKEIIESLIHNDEYKNARQEVKQTLWQKQGESAKNIVDFMVKTAY